MEGQRRITNGASARYIYAVIPRVAREDFGAIGIADARVYTLTHRAIAAVVHDCPPEPYQGEPETVAGWVKIHNDVIDTAWSEAGSVLPMRFNVIVKADGERSAEENVRQWLDVEYSNLQAKLDEFRNKVELGVQVLWDPAVIAQRIVESSEEIKALRAEMATKSRGTAYFIEHKIASAVKEEMERKAQSDFATCYQRLKERSEGTHVNKVRKQDARAMIANLSLLVRRERVQEIGAVLHEVGDEQGVEIRFTGPWPPYTFAATVGAIGGEPESSRRGNGS
jgi:thiamine phosphate synthase YjbQ (UPF0047 family)